MHVRFIDGEEVRNHLDYVSLVDALEEAHRAPPPQAERLLMTARAPGEEQDAFLIWPAWQEGEALGIKLVTSFPKNPRGSDGLPAIQALYVLFDGRDGRPLALIDATELTFWKTAADSALGARFLARADVACLLMVGAGALAPALIAAHRAVRPSLERVLVWNRTPEKAAALAERLKLEGLAAQPVDALEPAVREADVISAATGARTPLIRGAWLRSGTHVDLVGGFTPEMREADDEAIRRAQIYVDSRWFTLALAGDLSQPLTEGVIFDTDVRGDLFELARGGTSGRTDPAAITLFKNAGGAHLDLITAAHLIRQVEADRRAEA